jgi:hypothetical protein
MDFKSLLKSLDQLNEAETTRTKTGLVHKGDYGRQFDTDDEGNPVVKKEKSTEPKKRGAPVKADKPLTGKNDPKKQKVGDIFGRTTGEVPKGKKGMQHTPMKDADKEEKKAESLITHPYTGKPLDVEAMGHNDTIAKYKEPQGSAPPAPPAIKEHFDAPVDKVYGKNRKH